MESIHDIIDQQMGVQDVLLRVAAARRHQREMERSMTAADTEVDGNTEVELEEQIVSGTWVSPIDRFSILRPERPAERRPEELDGTEAEPVTEYTSQLLAILTGSEVEVTPESSETVLRRYMLDLGFPVIPLASPLCPELETVHQAIDNRQLFVTVYSAEGYNFNSEFVRIYKGDIKWKWANTTFKSLLRRALFAASNTLSAAEADTYTRHILRICCWESKLSIDTATDTIKVKFPSLYARVESRASFREVKVFVGADDNGELYFWIRITFPLLATSLPEGPIRKLMKRKYIDICYCRRYSLCSADVHELEAKGLVESNKQTHSLEAVPPPPPKVVAPEDIRLFLLHDTISRDQESFDDLVEDYVSEFADQGHTMAQAQPVRREIMLRAEPLKSLNANAAYSSELIGWGENSDYSLGLATEGSFPPLTIPIPVSLALERIRMIACSPRHTLILSYIGNIYSCGENTEGALGVGDTYTRTSFTLVSFPQVDDGGADDDAVGPKFVKVAAGSGVIGSHSMAIDSENNLYSWGTRYLTGHGFMKDQVLVPTLVQTFPDVASGSSNSPAETAEDVQPGQEDNTDDDDAADIDQHKVVDVSCGAGFTVAILKSGRVASWGVYIGGRLGLGPPPRMTAYSRREESKKKVARYQLRPKVVEGIFNAISVSCGEAHTLCVAGENELFSWGQNSCGQLGVGCDSSGFLLMYTYPVAVRPFSQAVFTTEGDHVRAVSATCGSYHSLVIDGGGFVWSWGARGGSCLGHNDAPLLGPWMDRIEAVFTKSAKVSRVMVPYELLSWCNRWATPRRIQISDGVAISAVHAGDNNTVMLSTSGQLYICGSGSAVPQFSAHEDISFDNKSDVSRISKHTVDDNSITAESKVAEGSEIDTEVAYGAEDNGKRLASLTSSLRRHITSPRCPSDIWLTKLYTRRVLHVSSSGSKVFVLLNDEIIADAMAKLCKRAVLGTQVPAPRQMDAAASDDASLDSGLYSQNSSSSLFEQRGRVDCLVLASGKVLLCHRALLSHRSPVLRDLIYEEYSGTVSEITHIMLPDLHTDTARALLAFIYTDVLPAQCAGNLTLLRNLSRCGQSLKMPRLRLLCDQALRGLSSPLDSASKSFDVEFGLDTPPVTLTRDLTALLGDQQFADVRFVVEDKEIFAHRFILEARSEYFRVMFQSGMLGLPEGAVQQEVISVVVPDSYIGFLRLLTFVYTHCLPEATIDALLDDLLTADRYNLQDMRLYCESMIRISESNWLDVLRVGHAINSARLVSETLAFLCLQSGELKKLHEDIGSGVTHGIDVANIMATVMEMRSSSHPYPPSQVMIDQSMFNAKADAADESAFRNPDVPWWQIGLVIVMTIFYPYVGRMVPSYGPVLPIINAVFTLGLLYFFFKNYF